MPALAQEEESTPHLTVDREAENAGWDAFVETTSGGHHAQTSMWARVKAVLGWDCVRLVIRDSDTILGGIQLLTREIGPLGRVAFAPRGPLLADSDPKLLDELLAAMLTFGREERVRYLKVQPPADRHDLVVALRERGWSSSSLEAAPTATVRVDLEPPAEEILARMRRQHRQHVRAAEKKGLRIRVGGESDLAYFYALVEATSSRQQFAAYPKRYYEAMWRVFAAEDRACLLMVERNESLLSGSLLIGFGDSATCKMTGWSGARGASPNEPMHWEGMQWGKERGCRWYDFDGLDRSVAVALRDKNGLSGSALPSIARFKLHFGGEAALFPGTLDISPNPALRPLVRVAAPRLGRSRSLAHRMLGRGAFR